MKISKIYYDFVQEEYAESYMAAEVGHPFHSYDREDGYDGLKVLSIIEHRPTGEGDKWFYDIELDGGKIVRVFNISAVFYEK